MARSPYPYTRTYLEDHFRRHVLRSAAEAEGLLVGLDPLCQTQVHQLHVATAGEETVLRLQVPGGTREIKKKNILKGRQCLCY